MLRYGILQQNTTIPRTLFVRLSTACRKTITSNPTSNVFTRLLLFFWYVHDIQFNNFFLFLTISSSTGLKLILCDAIIFTPHQHSLSLYLNIKAFVFTFKLIPLHLPIYHKLGNSTKRCVIFVPVFVRIT